ncbi:unnamed protein product [Rhizophagus irregularis]|nr:unnamed protein product [Rhizophagus irregularis]
MFDPAYSELLDTNQELRSELRDEDNTIIAYKKDIEKLKSEISDLRKQLRVLQRDKKFKDEVGSIQDGRIIELENKGVGTPMQNPANVIDGIRGSLNTIRVTLQNITAERDQYQNLLHDSIHIVVSEIQLANPKSEITKS